MDRPWPASLAPSVVMLALALGPAASAVGCNVEEPARDAAPNAARDAASARRPELVPAAAGELDLVVREALAQAQRDGRRLVVYVGASWCEPCTAFHEAVERGELDEPLAGVRFVELDADQDRARMQAAGYDGRYIPRFVLPLPDGRGSEQRMEGGIKGPGAVANLMERLEPLLAGG